MKIRIKGNSLRYRLTQSEVKRFEADGYLQERVEFAEQVLIYALQKTNDTTLSASFIGNKITMLMPQALALEWFNTDTIGFENKTTNFYLLLEKDFVCLDNVAEDQSDNYPNPLAEHLRIC